MTESESKKVEYLMFDGTIKTELTEEDQINCRGILVHNYFDSEEELLEFEKEWRKKRDAIIIKHITKEGNTK